MNNAKKRLYVFECCQDGTRKVLRLTDEQAAVFMWLIDEGFDFSLHLMETMDAEEISTNILKESFGTVQRSDQ